MQLLGTILGKATFAALRLSGRSGSALPGLVVEKFFPGYLSHALETLPQGVLVVSGTNGKTTTTSLLVALLESQGLRVLTNETGSNFVRGVVSATVARSRWSGQLPYDIAVFEQDEAHAVHFVEHVKPRGAVLLNITRDQMDRFGEIDTTAQLLAHVAASATEWVVLNANDERIGKFRVGDGVRRRWFAHSEQMRSHFRSDDQLYSQDAAKHVLVGEPSVWLELYDHPHVEIRRNTASHRYEFGLKGMHNALNLTAALTALYEIVPQPDEEAVVRAIVSMSPVFGRGEVVTLPSGGALTLQLIKNPSGFTQALKMLEVEHFDEVGIAINDDYADGRDVSWLWDVSYECLEKYQVYCGGDRAADMALRLKYDEVPRAIAEPRLKPFLSKLDRAVPKGKHAILFCTYTAMRAIRVEMLGAASGLEEKS